MTPAPVNCPQCNIRPRPKGRHVCPECKEENRKRNAAHFLELARQKRAAEKNYMQCWCGCGVQALYPARYATDDCRERAKKETQKRYKQMMHTKVVEPKPSPVVIHRPILTEAEQTAINEEAIRREAARVDAIHKAMGLVASVGRPLASEPVRLSLEEIRQLEGKYQPPSRGRGILPYAIL